MERAAPEKSTRPDRDARIPSARHVSGCATVATRSVGTTAICQPAPRAPGASSPGTKGRVTCSHPVANVLAPSTRTASPSSA